ncbi:MAG TPA: hypothetical protein VEX38_09875 [Fimbriimonadaceae bacterium]|nr:hypothetical protein [Fimbriimonadaceae bacterium]
MNESESFSSEATVASLALHRLCADWLAQMADNDPDHPAPRQADATQLACLLLAYESREDLIIPISNAHERCLQRSMLGVFAHMDSLPWLMIESYVSEGVLALRLRDRLQKLLFHPDSSIRWWFHYVAWMVRHDLDREAVTRIMLCNVADKLAHVELSAGFLGSFYDDTLEIDELAASYHPYEFEEQYRQRLEFFRGGQWFAEGHRFCEAEHRARQMIWEAVRNIPISDA